MDVDGDYYRKPQSEYDNGMNTHKVKYRIVIDKHNNRYVGTDILKRFNFQYLTYGDRMNYLDYFEGLAIVSVDDNDMFHGSAEIDGKTTYCSDGNQPTTTIKVVAEFRNNVTDGDCYFICTSDDNEIVNLGQAKFRNGTHVVSLCFAYDYAHLNFSEYLYQSIPYTSKLGKEVWYYVDAHNTNFNVNRLLKLVPELNIDSHWRTKLEAAELHFTEINIDA